VAPLWPINRNVNITWICQVWMSTNTAIVEL
jgi:hypothetical protein